MPNDPGASNDKFDTVTLLAAWQRGDVTALDRLVAREMPWLLHLVQRRLGQMLRARHDTQDIVQEALLGTLRDGSRYLVEDRRHLRALLATVVENVIRREREHFTAKRRDVRRDAILPASELGLDLSFRSPFTRASRAAQADEERAWIRLALELLDADDRDVIMLREYQGLEFATVGAALSIGEDAARMRFSRALQRLGAALDRLRSGRLGQMLEREEESP